MYVQVIAGSLFSSAPALVGWIVAVVLAAVMLRRGGARAERFLLIGACLMLLASILAIPTQALNLWLHTDRGMPNAEIAFWLSIYSLFRGLIGLAGIICLVYAFWVKFKTAK